MKSDENENDRENGNAVLLISFIEQSVDWICTENLPVGDDFMFHPDGPLHHHHHQAPPWKGNVAKLVVCANKQQQQQQQSSLLAKKFKHYVNTKLLLGGNKQNKNGVKCLPDSWTPELLLERFQASHDGDEDSFQMQQDAPALPDHFEFQSPDPTYLPIYYHHSGSVMEGIILISSSSGSSNNEREAILSCASRLYRQLWMWRCCFGRRVSQVHGFCVSNNHNGLSVSKVQLSLPMAGLGAKFPLLVSTRRAPLQEANVLLQELGDFILSTPSSTSNPNPNPWQAPALLTRSPGAAMLLSDDLQERMGDETSSNATNDDEWRIIPTVTGSLVIRCRNLEAVKTLLSLNAMTLDGSQDETSSSSSWYVKCKTPACFGSFWDTAAVAITATRGRLESSKRSLSKDQVHIAQAWLSMHPFDAMMVLPHCHMTVVRDMGVRFRGQLPWKSFVNEFQSLMDRTMVFQTMTKLIHGDIHENNVLLSHHEDGSSTSSMMPRLVLIDWDEALRDKPCFRKADTKEERLRYPNSLRDFPAAYTKQQLLHLFAHLVREYYSATEQEWDEDSSFVEDGVVPTVARVEARYRKLSRFLESIN